MALDGTVVGKGEIIERNPTRIGKPLKLDSISQADSFSIDFDITQRSIDDEDEEAAKKRIDFAYSKDIAAQVVEKLETHKKRLRRDSNFDLSVDKKNLNRGDTIGKAAEHKPEQADANRLPLGKEDTIEKLLSKDSQANISPKLTLSILTLK